MSTCTQGLLDPPRCHQPQSGLPGALSSSHADRSWLEAGASPPRKSFPKTPPKRKAAFFHLIALIVQVHYIFVCLRLASRIKPSSGKTGSKSGTSVGTQFSALHLLRVSFKKPFFFFVFLFTAESVAYASPQARGQIGTAAASLHHSHSSADLSRICDLCCSLWQHHILNPLRGARDGPCIFMDPSWVLNPLSHNGSSPETVME